MLISNSRENAHIAKSVAIKMTKLLILYH